MKKESFVFLFLLFAIMVNAQQPVQLPLDPKVRYGKLDNGLTYYISHNALPEKCGEFYIVQKVGSMQEEDDQAGLAHFLEHMAFSSTKHFPDKVLDGLERYGAQMGANMNAYTSFDQTVYYLSGIPLNTPGAVDTCLLILHDWAGFINLQDDKIDKERLVIKEEWRTRSGASSRIMEKALPVMMAGSKYSDRMPIGKMEVVENFSYQTLKDYYHKWYRPDLQGLIVVGDFDVDEVEAKIKTLFADIPKPVNPAERIYYTVPDNDEPIVAIFTDKEATGVSMSIYYKQDGIPRELRNTREGRVLGLTRRMVHSMLSGRLTEIRQKPESPFNSAYAHIGNFYAAQTKDAFTLGASSKEEKIRETFETLIRELDRAKRFGFTKGEIERTKANVLQSYENAYNNRNKQQNSSRVSPYMSHFLEGSAAMGIEYEYPLSKEILEELDAESLHNYLKEVIGEKNIVITLTGPEKESINYPTESELISLMKKTLAENISPYVDTMSSRPLISNLPKPGSIIKTEVGQKYGETIWTLSNGMKVVLKKTDYSDDQIIFSANGFGGNSLFEDKEWLDIRYLNSVARLGGIGEFDNVELGKALAGKTVYVAGSVGQFTQSISGSSTKKDVETLLQLVYLHFTSPRKDMNAYAAFLEREKNGMKNRDSNPNVIFSDTLTRTIYGDNLRVKRPVMEDLERINYDRILEMYKESFANAGSFVVTLIGTVDEDVLKPLVEKYLASLPSGNKEMTYKEVSTHIKKGKITNHFNQKMETPMATSFLVFSGNLKRDANTFIRCEALNKILRMVFTRTIRGEEGGSYGVSANIGSERIPFGDVMLQVRYTTNPERVGDMNQIVYRELRKLAEEGPLEDEFQKAIEAVIKDRTGWQIQNGFWRAVLDIYYQYGEEENLNYLARIKSIKPEELQQMVKELLEQENVIEVVMTP